MFPFAETVGEGVDATPVHQEGEEEQLLNRPHRQTPQVEGRTRRQYIKLSHVAKIENSIFCTWERFTLSRIYTRA